MNLGWIVAIVIAYLLGSVPTGYIVVKKLTGQDIRQHGSGNVGATNVKRVAGTKAFIFVMFFDMLKGLLPVLAARYFFPDAYLVHVLVAFASVLGHSKSIFLKFSGGKSAATGLGGIFGLAFIPAAILGLMAFLIIKFTRMVSIGTLTAALTCPFLVYIFHKPVEYVIYCAIVCLYVVYLHRANIGRLAKGTENRI